MKNKNLLYNSFVSFLNILLLYEYYTYSVINVQKMMHDVIQ